MMLPPSSDGPLWCPVCHTEDSHGNTMDGKPFCMQCRRAFVPQSEFYKLSRVRRRRWKPPEVKAQVNAAASASSRGVNPLPSGEGQRDLILD